MARWARPVVAALVAAMVAGCLEPPATRDGDTAGHGRSEPDERVPDAHRGGADPPDDDAGGGGGMDCGNRTRATSVRWAGLPGDAPRGLVFVAQVEAGPPDACVDSRAVYLANASIPPDLRGANRASFGRADTGEALGGNVYGFRIVAPLHQPGPLRLRAVVMGAGHEVWSPEAQVNLTEPPPLPPDQGDCTRWPPNVSLAQANPAANASSDLRVEPRAFDRADARCVVVMTNGCGFCAPTTGFQGAGQHWALAVFENLRVLHVRYNVAHQRWGFHVRDNITHDPGVLRSVLALSPRATDAEVWVTEVRAGVVDGGGAPQLLDRLRAGWLDEPPPQAPCADCAPDQFRYSPEAGTLRAADTMASYDFADVMRALERSAQERGLNET